MYTGVNLPPTRGLPAYAIFHPENGGSLHSQFLGSGIQGTATLVRSRATCQLMARKRTCPQHLNNKPFADLDNAINHPNVVRLLGSERYHREKVNGTNGSAVSLWEFANCKDLKHLIMNYRKSGERVPELLIWQFLKQMFGAYDALHRRQIAHMDGHWSNVFVNFDPLKSLPEFILGDLGLSEPFKQGFQRIYASEEGAPGIVDDDYNSVPTLQNLHDYDEDNDQNVLDFFIGESLPQVGEDMARLSGALNCMMHDDDSLDFAFYSPSLNKVATMMMNMKSFLWTRHVKTQKNAQILISMLRQIIEHHFADCVSQVTFPVPGIELSRPQGPTPQPMLFASPEALLAADYFPPGPWYVAQVDPYDCQVLNVDYSVVYGSDAWYCFDAQGSEVTFAPEFDDDDDNTSDSLW
ncbi:uncharacterized protein HMPREF1541_07947 [Cyphellophora europaea CBS 101466]|uniref:Protein kinase domain-containing protein n=1 Tax=Cyphellophora europaea (strain CBS 101466) TaxID=1220924 RepID=W2RML4_CYPE1|nr:uncharacterized protein HMPREF1541_07947 [Cyphellophora europaea CBS 101466]ETN36959.1 hypothetical protein HMPREF1541_07947 [Cyphellophora europaea CBS 101466]